MGIRAFAPLFFVSGMSGLIFEVLWQREMIHVFGSSAPAISAILTAFFLGIALGSWGGGALLVRFKNRISTLQFYALTELWIGLFGIMVPVLLSQVNEINVLLFSGADPGSTLSVSMLYKFLMSILVVLPATLGMGATIPIMSQLIHEHENSVGRSVGLAYGINTAGAVIGCLGAGFVLLPQLGIQNSLNFALMLNLSVAVGSYLLSKRTYTLHVSEPATADEQNNINTYVLMSIYFLCGFVALGFEVAWLRIIAIFNANDVITFTTTLSIYLLGFSIGSTWLFAKLEKKVSKLQILVFSMGGVAITSMLTLANAQTVNNVLFTTPLLKFLSVNGFFTFQNFFNPFFLMFVPAVFMGLAFPAVTYLINTNKKSVALSSGFVYFIGNLGSALGAAITGLLLIPAFGLKVTPAIFIALNIILLLIVSLMDKSPNRRRMLQASIALGAVLIIGLSFVVNDIPYVKMGSPEPTAGGWALDSKTKIIKSQSGRSSTVHVYENTGNPDLMGRTMVWRSIQVDDQPVASTSPAGQVDGKMLAHIPLLLHPNPKSALTVGFGSGGTSWSMITHGIKTTAVEIEPEMIKAASYFTKNNHNVVNHPNFRVVLNDARNYLHTTQDMYDVISTDVTNLTFKQNSSLYTEEYFNLMKAHLTEDGVACAWIPLGGINDHELKVLLRTFSKVWPHSSFWFMDQTYTTFAILIGTPKPLTIDFNRLKAGFENPLIKEDLAEIAVHDPEQIIQFLYLNEKEWNQYVGTGPLHTDDKPLLEFIEHSYQGLNGNRVVGFAKLKPKSWLPIVKNLSEKEIAQYQKNEEFARRLGEFNIFKYFVMDHRDRDYVQMALNRLKQILTLKPDYAPALENTNVFEARLKVLGSGR